MTRPRNYLFSSFVLDDQLRSKQTQAVAAVDAIPEEQFLISSDEDIVANLVVRYSIDPIEIHEDQAQLDQRETKVDVAGDPRRAFRPGTTGPFHIPGTEVSIKIPFSGDAELWEGRTNPWTSML